MSARSAGGKGLSEGLRVTWSMHSPKQSQASTELEPCSTNLESWKNNFFELKTFGYFGRGDGGGRRLRQMNPFHNFETVMESSAPWRRRRRRARLATKQALPFRFFCFLRLGSFLELKVVEPRAGIVEILGFGSVKSKYMLSK